MGSPRGTLGVVPRPGTSRCAMFPRPSAEPRRRPRSDVTARPAPAAGAAAAPSCIHRCQAAVEKKRCGGPWRNGARPGKVRPSKDLSVRQASRQMARMAHALWRGTVGRATQPPPSSRQDRELMAVQVEPDEGRPGGVPLHRHVAGPAVEEAHPRPRRVQAGVHDDGEGTIGPPRRCRRPAPRSSSAAARRPGSSRCRTAGRTGRRRWTARGSTSGRSAAAGCRRMTAAILPISW